MNTMRANRKLIENTLIPHAEFEQAGLRLEQCYDYAADASEPICIALVGESRTGKSRLLEECEAKHPKVRKPEGLEVPILKVKTPSKPTVKSLAELMLAALQDPKPTVGTENAKTQRLKTLMRNVGVRMVVIDEFQHFVDKGSLKVMHHVADWLKILVDDARVALVVAGLPTCLAVLEQNEQLSGRFMSPVMMPRFDWKDGAQREEFIAILGAFQESMSEHFDIPDLASDGMAFRCYAGTGGLMGYLTKFLRQAVWNALDKKKRKITLEDLALAHDQSVWKKDGVIGIQSPFSRAFAVTPTEELLARIQQIGVTKVAAHTSHKRGRKADDTPGVRDVLTAH